MMLYTPMYQCSLCGKIDSDDTLEIGDKNGVDTALTIHYSKRIRHICPDGSIGVYRFMGLRKEAEPTFDNDGFDKLLDAESGSN